MLDARMLQLNEAILEAKHKQEELELEAKRMLEEQRRIQQKGELKQGTS